MNPELQEGRILQGRFVLERSLRTGAAAPLWVARDRHLDVSILLRVYPGLAGAEDAVRESILRDAKRHRRSRHPHAARICDMHEEEGLLFLSIEPHEGELLSAILARAGPMPYRHVVEKIRPLVESIMHLHESGDEHGRVDSDHVLVDEEHRWILLPGDGTLPARSDMLQLGRLIAAMLTGDRVPDPGRPLNDVADLLHRGRTVPALLDQLVGDLGMSDAAQRPAGMRDVLNRLDQIEEYVGPAPEPDEQTDGARELALEPTPVVPTEPEPAAAPTTAPPPPPSPVPPALVPPAPPGRSRIVTGPRLAWAAVLLVIVGGAAIVVPRAMRPQPAPDEAVVDDDREAPDPDDRPDAIGDDPEATEEDAAALAAAEAERAAAQAAADEALGEYLAARRSAEEIGAAAWAGAPYEAAAAQAAAADTAYLDEQFALAAQEYRAAAAAFELVAASRDEALRRLLREGGEALSAMNAAGATEALQAALLIDPGNDEAEAGLARATTLDELARLLGAGLLHEAEGRLALAHVEFASAAELDPRSGEAAEALARIKTRIADEEFRTMMARGLEAHQRGDYDEARRRFLEAQAFRPEATEVAQALAMVREARVRAAVERYREQAAAHEQAERWQEAWNAYRQVLAVDATIEFAQDGKARCEDLIRLHQHARHFLDDPELLLESSGRDDATRIVRELQLFPDKGPKLTRAYDELSEQVRLATTPLRVELRSDGKTEVDVYRVGRFGTLESKELTLLPGVYTVVGRRRGYRDVRLTLRLKAGAENTSVTVICTEKI